MLEYFNKTTAYSHAAASACMGEGNVWFAVTRAGEADVATLAKCSGCGQMLYAKTASALKAAVNKYTVPKKVPGAARVCFPLR